MILYGDVSKAAVRGSNVDYLGMIVSIGTSIASSLLLNFSQRGFSRMKHRLSVRKFEKDLSNRLHIKSPLSAIEKEMVKYLSSQSSFDDLVKSLLNNDSKNYFNYIQDMVLDFYSINSNLNDTEIKEAERFLFELISSVLHLFAMRFPSVVNISYLSKLSLDVSSKILAEQEAIQEHVQKLLSNQKVANGNFLYYADSFCEKHLFAESADEGKCATIKDVYISPRYYSKQSSNSDKDLLEHIESYIKNSLESPKNHKNEFKRTLLLEGEPGIGKTTLLYNFCYEKSVRNHFNDYNLFVVRLRELVSDSINIDNPLLDITNFLGISKYNLEKSILFLDGLDEICVLPSVASKIKEYLYSIANSTNTIKNLFIIITSRKLMRQQKAANIEYIELLPFNFQQQSLWVQKYKTIHPSLKITNINFGLEFLQIPLLLYISVVYNINTKGIGSKGELYEYIFNEFQLRTYDDSNNHIGEYIQPQALAELISIEMYRTSKEILDNATIEKLYELVYKNSENTKEIKIGNVFGFTFYYKNELYTTEFLHKSFREFLFSRYIFRVLTRALEGDDSSRNEIIDLFRINYMNSNEMEFIEYFIKKSSPLETIASKIVGLLYSFLKEKAFIYSFDPFDVKHTLANMFEIISHTDILYSLNESAGQDLARALRYCVMEIDNHGFNFSNIRMTSIDFSHCNFSHSSFRNVKIEKCNFSHGNFEGVRISGVMLNCNFSNANLSRASLSDASFHRCKFYLTQLTNSGCIANFKKCEITQTDITGSSFKGAWLINTKLLNLWYDDGSFDYHEMIKKRKIFAGCTIEARDIKYIIPYINNVDELRIYDDVMAAEFEYKFHLNRLTPKDALEALKHFEYPENMIKTLEKIADEDR